MHRSRQPIPVVIRPATAPDGTQNVLLQLPDGFVLMGTADARQLAKRLLSVADEVDGV